MRRRCRWASCGCRSGAAQAGRADRNGPRRGRSGPGRSRAQAGWGTCSPSSSSPPASRCWTSSPSSAPGSGCCHRASRARTTRTTPGRSPSPRCARRPAARGPADDHAVVLKVWAKRHRDLARLRCQAACRLHAALCEIIPGGVPKAITATRGRRPAGGELPAGPVEAARHQLAAELAADLRRIDDKLRRTRKKITAAVRAVRHHPDRASSASARSSPPPSSATSPTSPGSQPGPLRRLQRHRPGRGVLRQPEDLPAVPARQPADEPRHPHGRRHPDPPAAQRRPRLLRQETSRGQDTARRRSAPSSARSATPSTPAPSRRPAAARTRRSGPGRATGERL